MIKLSTWDRLYCHTIDWALRRMDPDCLEMYHDTEQDWVDALKAFQKGYEEYLGGDRANIPPYYRVDFSILYPLEGDTGPFKELWKDGPSIAQFTGTATYYFEVSGENLNVTVYDDKTEYSLLYHIPGTDKHERSERKFLGKTKQYYSFTISLEEVKLRVQQDENK